MFSFQGASSSKSNPQLAFWNVPFQNSTVALFLLSNQNPLRGAFDWYLRRSLLRDSMKHWTAFALHCFSQSLMWWRVPGSNRWPPACKAGALPAELTPHRGSFFEVVGQNGLEPSTSRLSVVCSSQLSYWPIPHRNQIHNLRFEIPISKLTCGFVSPLRIKPASLGFASVPLLWWRVPGSNRWPPACKAGALPAELTPHTRDPYFFRYINSVPSKLNNVTSKLFLTLVLTLGRY